jgi:hypothetical protein
MADTDDPLTPCGLELMEKWHQPGDRHRPLIRQNVPMGTIGRNR